MLLKPLIRGAVTAAAVATAALMPQGHARTIAGGAPDLNRLVQASDVICVAEVQGVRTEFIDRRIETTYTLAVDEFLAGAGPETFEMTVLGGAVEEPFPMAFVFDGMVVLSEQQDVVLFLADRSANNASPALQRAAAAGTTPSFGAALTPTFGDLGVFTVLTDPATGQKFVSQINYGAMGVAVTPQVNSLVVQRVESSMGLRSGGDTESVPLTDIAVTTGQQSPARDPRIHADEDMSVPGLPPGPRTHWLDETDQVLNGGSLSAPTSARRAASAAHAEEETGPAATSSALRTLGDFTAEIEHLISEEGN